MDKQYILVKINKEKYGIDIQQVQNIDRLSNITRVPKAPHYIKGVINLRGDIIPVMSLRLKLGMDADTYTNNTRIIIVKTEEHTMGIIVDEVNEVVDLDCEKIENMNGFSNKINKEYIIGLGKLEEDIIILLSMEGLINQQ